MTLASPEFWANVCAILLLYTYVGYPFFVSFWAAVFPKSFQRRMITPRVTVLILRPNRPELLPRAIQSIYRLPYPSDQIESRVVEPGDRLFPDDMSGEIVVMMDGGGVLPLGAIPRLLSHFQDPSVGAVTGVGIFFQPSGWYETPLRSAESRAGLNWGPIDPTLFAVRREWLQIAHRWRDLSHVAELRAHLAYNRQRILFDPLVSYAEIVPSFRRPSIFERWMDLTETLSQTKHVPLSASFIFQWFSREVFRWLTPFVVGTFWLLCAASPNVSIAFWAQTIVYSLLGVHALIRGWLQRRAHVAAPAKLVSPVLPKKLQGGVKSPSERFHIV